MSNENVETQNFNMINLSAIELGKIWRQNLSEKIPDHLPKSILARILAYRIQSERQGGLSKKAIAYLKPIVADLREGRSPITPYPNERKLKLGCQLVREHDGIDHRVTVVDDGYNWQGKTYHSLSSVAKAITGTNWNGHRFFGLKAKVERFEEMAL
jgi:Protein of unknown function (DUF2924)